MTAPAVTLRPGCAQHASVTMRQSSALTIAAAARKQGEPGAFLWWLTNHPSITGGAFVLAGGSKWLVTFPEASHYTLRFDSGQCVTVKDGQTELAATVSVTVKP